MAWSREINAEHFVGVSAGSQIGDQGLSVEEYESILEVAQNDPDVREKIRQRIRPSVQ